MCVAAFGGRLCAAQLLLLLHPAVAGMPDAWGWVPAHSAASGGSAAVLQLLMAVAPQTALAKAAHFEHTPLAKALQRRKLQAASYLAGVGPADAALATLVEYMHGGLDPKAPSPDERQLLCAHMFADFAIARCPLPAQQWQRFPMPCHGLERALPAALRHSHAQARMLVQRMMPDAAARLRCALLCLGRQQRCCGVQLPPPLLEHILCTIYEQRGAM